MTAALGHAPSPRSDPVAAFELRCWARATLVREGEMAMQDAVDGLQADAMRNGVINQIGQDAVQSIMATAFSDVPCIPDITEPESAKAPLGAARSTLDAAEFLVRQHDPASLKAWLARHTAAERSAIRDHFARKRAPWRQAS